MEFSNYSFAPAKLKNVTMLHTQRTAVVFGRRSSPHLIVLGCSISQLMSSVVIVALITANIFYANSNGFKARYNLTPIVGELSVHTSVISGLSSAVYSFPSIHVLSFTTFHSTMDVG
jgi:hypothetical protein